MKHLSEIIRDVVTAKKGDNEFALFHVNGSWRACIGNTCVYVYLGESEAEVSSDWHDTPEHAVTQLLALVTTKQAT